MKTLALVIHGTANGRPFNMPIPAKQLYDLARACPTSEAWEKAAFDFTPYKEVAATDFQGMTVVWGNITLEEVSLEDGQPA